MGQGKRLELSVVNIHTKDINVTKGDFFSGHSLNYLAPFKQIE